MTALHSVLPRQAASFKAVQARFGWVKSIEVMILWLLRKTIGYREAGIYRLDLDGGLLSAGFDGIDWGYKAPHEINPEALVAAGLDPATLETAMRRGDKCFAGEEAGAICYLSIVSTAGFLIPERLSVQFTAKHESYVGNCFTLAAYRGKGIYPRALLQLGAALRAEEVDRLYLFIERENLASIRSVEKAGFVRVAACRVLQWRGSAKRMWSIKKHSPGISNATIKLLP